MPSSSDGSKKAPEAYALYSTKRQRVIGGLKIGRLMVTDHRFCGKKNFPKSSKREPCTCNTNEGSGTSIFV
jgi:hypothetical protein